MKRFKPTMTRDEAEQIAWRTISKDENTPFPTDKDPLGASQLFVVKHMGDAIFEAFLRGYGEGWKQRMPGWWPFG